MSPAAATPQPPAPNVAHTVVDERVRLAVMEVGFTDPLARRAFHDDAAHRSASAELGELVTHLMRTGTLGA